MLIHDLSYTFQNALVCPPCSRFSDGLSESNLGKPVLELAIDQHAAYCDALSSVGLSLVALPPDEEFPDSTFVEDTALTFPEGKILCRPGADSRCGESIAIERALPITERITSPGTVDGGDICVADRVVFIGLSNRTNREGARQLDAILQAWGYTCLPIDLTIPILREAGLLHLKSGMSYLGDRLFVLDDRLYVFSQELASALGNHGYNNPILVGNEAYAANCIRVNDSVLVAEGYPNFAENLHQAIRTGRSSIRQVIPLAMSEFKKMDGGLSCLSLRW